MVYRLNFDVSLIALLHQAMTDSSCSFLKNLLLLKSIFLFTSNVNFMKFMKILKNT